MPFRACRLRLGLCLALLVLFCAAPVGGQASQQPLATVNGTAITSGQVRREAAILQADMRLRRLLLPQELIGEEDRPMVELLIDRELLYQRAQQRGIAISHKWVERALADLKDKIGNASGFDAYLKNIDLDEAQLRERISKGLIIRRLLHREVIRQIKVSEREMQAFYKKHPDFFIRRDQIRVRQIFIAADRSEDAASRGAALLRIQSIQNQLKQGANFTVLALEYSEDPSKARGGDLGYLERTEMIPAFADAAFALQPGQISDIVETPLGYHLIQLVDRIPTKQMAYRNARWKIERTLRRNKEEAAVADYLAQLKRQAVIKR